MVVVREGEDVGAKRSWLRKRREILVVFQSILHISLVIESITF